MAKVLVEETNLTNIANAIRKKTGKSDLITPPNMANEIDGIQAGGGVELYEEDWLDDVVFWDYDGTIVARYTVEEANKLTELPIPPTHDGLTFQEWNHTLEEVQNSEIPLDIGATYIPSDGKTHLKANIYNASYLALPLYYSTDVADAVTIDWGDGSSDTISTTGAGTTSHTYASTGEYEIVITVNDGCVLTLGQGGSSKVFFGGNATYRFYLAEAYIGNNINFGTQYTFYNDNLEVLTIPKGVTSLPNYLLYYCYALKALIIPRGVTETSGIIWTGSVSGSYAVQPILSVPSTLIPNQSSNLVSGIPLSRLICSNTSVSDLGRFFSSTRDTKRIFFNKNFTSIGEYSFNESSLKEFVLPDTITNIGAYPFYNCYSLERVVLSQGITGLPDNSFYYCGMLQELIIPPNVTTIGKNLCYQAVSLKRVIVKSVITSISTTYLLYNCYSLREIIFTQDTPPSSFTFNYLKGNYFIYVPDNAIDTYKTKFKSYSARFKPLSEYRGKRDWED